MSHIHSPTAGSPPKRGNLVGTPTHVSDSAFDYLLSSMLHWVEEECSRSSSLLSSSLSTSSRHGHDNDNGAVAVQGTAENHNTVGSGDNNSSSNHRSQETQLQDQVQQQQQQQEEERLKQMVLLAENAAAKMERMGYDVGYRLAERLVQNKSLVPTLSSTSTSSGKVSKPTPAMIQLEIVKFICKDFWNEIFRKQIDKLQTNHRGVFVLKDLEFKWLMRLPSDVEMARIMAIKILAFPCGLIRGALANLDMVSVVSCDFLADGKNMHACSFNIKVKS